MNAPMRILVLSLLLLILSGCDVNPAERNNAGNSLSEQGNYAEAVQAYQAAQVASPDDPIAYYNAGSALSRSGRGQPAVDVLRQALKTADDTLAAQAYYNLGNVYFEMGLYEDALDAYRQALILQPVDTEARHNYELALSRLPTVTPPPQTADPETEEDDTDRNPPQYNEPDTQETPTPESADDSPDYDSVSAEPDEQATVSPEHDGTLSIEDAERLLDAVDQNQQTLREFLQRLRPPETPSYKDW
jgi:tetratricopeptide (TPR) repeat protein